MKPTDERRADLRRLLALPDGINRVYAILIERRIPFDRLPIGTLMIEAILAYESLGCEQTKECDR